MSHVSQSTDRYLGPERPRGQGLGVHQDESGNRAILALLTDPEVRDQVDLVMTWREGSAGEPGAYEVWSARGLVRFRRLVAPGGGLDFEIVEVVGTNPIEEQDPSALRSVLQEIEAARREPVDGGSPDDAARRYIAPGQQTYPFAYERIAQLFDSPNAPDLAVSPTDWAFGTQPGTHGALHVRQARAPLWLCGPRVRAGIYDLAARAVDIAPSVLAALDFPKIDGADATGRSALERAAEPDVYLARQDGRVLEEILDLEAKPPKRLYLFLLDGLHQTALEERLATDATALPNLRRLREGSAVLASGSIVNFPSITWPSHTAIGTGAWCGHHDVVNPTYFLRDTQETVSPQGQQVHSEGFASDGVESLYEAFHRVRGKDAMTAAIYAPFGRGARHAVLEGRNLCNKARLKEMNGELSRDQDPRWQEQGIEAVGKESLIDSRGIAQVIDLFTRSDMPPPDFVFHELVITDGAGHDCGPHSEGLQAALDESDRRVGRVLDLLEQTGLYEETLFVMTADHGMAPQNVDLRANPARHVEKIGLAGFVAEPMIWLRDLAVDVERAPDGRTARVRVRDNDALSCCADPDDEVGDFEGADVVVEAARPGAEPHVLARGRTGPGGVFGFATPVDLESNEVRVLVTAEGFNRRRVRLDGKRLAIDLRAALFGSAAKG